MIDTNIFQDKTAVYYTLGCKLNFSETSTIGKILRDAGVRTARKGEKADICVVNTCSVTEVADKKCRQAIHRLVKQHPGAFVVVTGCYAQLKPETVAKIEGVDVVLGAEQKKDLLQYLGNLQKNESGEAYASALKDIHSFAPSCSRGDPLFSESTGWLRLFLLLLYHSFRPRAESQWNNCIHGGTSPPGCGRGRKRNCADGCQYRGFR